MPPPRRPEPKVVRQEVHWVDLPLNRAVPLSEHPYRVWTLYGPGRDDPMTPPSLPIAPVHNQGAFLEDYIHDWTYRYHPGQERHLLRYGSRVTNEGTWILVEYADHNPFTRKS